MKVRIKSRYSLRDEDLYRLKEDGHENKIRWWMKNEDKQGAEAFVQLPRDTMGNDLLNVEVDISPGRYSAGCGNWGTASADGSRKAYQRLYFYVTVNGGVVYIDRKADLPELDDIVNGRVDEPDPADQFDEEQFEANLKAKEQRDSLMPIEGVLYCRATREGVSTFERIVMPGDGCDDYLEDTPGDGFGCGNCLFSEAVYLMN